MKTYDLATWSGFPFDQEVLKEIQNYYQSGMNAFFESMKPTAPFLVGGCNIISGSLEAGGVISDGIAYHPTHGLMLVKGGVFADDATITINVLTTNLAFEGANNHPAEISKYIEIDNNGGDFAFVNLVQSKWYNVLGALTAGSEWVVMPGSNTNGSVVYKYNPLTKLVEVRGQGLWGHRSAGPNEYFNEILGPSGFVSSSFFQMPAHLRPRHNVIGIATFHNNTPQYNPLLYRRDDGQWFIDAPITLTSSHGYFRLSPYPMWPTINPFVIYFNMMYML